MKNLALILSLTFIMMLGSCSSGKTTAYNGNLAEEIADKNNKTIPLLDRIRRLPGITLRGGIPYFMKSANQISGTATEPLYVLNGYILGNSFESLDQLVDSATIKSISALSSSEAASYGSRGGSGVIKITTY
ncbi:MAG: TonB-dependent receptor plug domain-containing protein [Bacteroidota bacterium]|uniref:TonB-dependent receptor plug domain-containing protein n=1 Tax=Flagellimonas profundi TaxID=2915620 RepID=A0ABS3FGV3_9FLAO|nr:TonB-dependent receptor plug domain-containing protein [Allomuricauda profundi]MBO0342293.1 TonB-dependent receptor plug domain-containing protein [Allomuricauda profundi]MEC7772811.1 TonB-dependent receptor plug domain-containing protein [Bacteroidota bacterium]